MAEIVLMGLPPPSPQCWHGGDGLARAVAKTGMTLQERSIRMSAVSTHEHRDHHGNPDELKKHIAR
jgi:hypothetical protein